MVSGKIQLEKIIQACVETMIIWTRIERMDKFQTVLGGKSHRTWLRIGYGNEGRVLSHITLLALYPVDRGAVC